MLIDKLGFKGWNAQTQRAQSRHAVAEKRSAIQCHTSLPFVE
jgi:hypothetical protein